MHSGIKALVLSAAMAFTGAAIAADSAPAAGGTPPAETPKRPARAAGLRGKVESTTATTIVIKGRDNAEKTITVDANTKYTVDGEAGDLTKVVAGVYVTATPETGTATEVKVSTKPPQRGNRGGAGGNAAKPTPPADPAK